MFINWHNQFFLCSTPFFSRTHSITKSTKFTTERSTTHFVMGILLNKLENAKMKIENWAKYNFAFVCSQQILLLFVIINQIMKNETGMFCHCCCCCFTSCFTYHICWDTNVVISLFRYVCVCGLLMYWNCHWTVKIFIFIVSNDDDIKKQLITSHHMIFFLYYW